MRTKRSAALCRSYDRDGFSPYATSKDVDRAHYTGDKIEKRNLLFFMHAADEHPARAEQRPPLSIDARLQDLIEYPRFGSFWWVSEEIWKRELVLYDEISNREAHPGVSLLSEKATDDFDAVPILYGRSKQCKGCVKVMGLSRNEPQKETWFGRYISPAVIPIVQWPTWQQVSTRHRSACPVPVAIPNDFKPEATQHEKEQFKSWCRKNGLRI